MATVAEKMTAIGDAIRAKTGGTEKLTLDQMASEINGMKKGFPNGTEWTQSNIISGDFGSVYEANGLWVACSTDNHGLYYSTNGKEWNQSNITSGRFYAVYYANSFWVATSNAGVYYSFNTFEWTQTDITSGNFPILCYTKGYFIVGGDNGLFISPLPMAQWGKIMDKPIYSLCHVDGTLVVASSAGLYYSTDVFTWTQSNITSSNFDSVYNVNSVWFATGSSVGLYYSYDGMTWTQSNITTGHFYSICGVGYGLVGGGFRMPLYYSTDGGANWTESNINMTDLEIYSICYAKGILVAAGTYGLYYSYNGVEWVQSNVISGAFSNLCYKNGIWLAGSEMNNGIFYSTDGMTWIQSNLATNGFFTISNANGVWVAAGENGLYYSVAWEP